jgi:hypothetical protein
MATERDQTESKRKDGNEIENLKKEMFHYLFCFQIQKAITMNDPAMGQFGESVDLSTERCITRRNSVFDYIHLKAYGQFDTMCKTICPDYLLVCNATHLLTISHWDFMNPCVMDMFYHVYGGEQWVKEQEQLYHQDQELHEQIRWNGQEQVESDSSDPFTLPKPSDNPTAQETKNLLDPLQQELVDEKEKLVDGTENTDEIHQNIERLEQCITEIKDQVRADFEKYVMDNFDVETFITTLQAGELPEGRQPIFGGLVCK